MPARPSFDRETGPSQSQAPVHRRAFASKLPALSPQYTHLPPCSNSQSAVTLLASGSTAIYKSATFSCPLHAPVESDVLTAIALAPSADRAVLAHRSANVRIHELPPTNPPSPPRAFRPFNNSNVVSFIAVHPSGVYAAFAGADGSIRIHDLSSFSLTHTLSTKAPITSLTFPPSQGTADLIAGCDDGSIRLFNLFTKSHAPAVVVRPHVARVTSLVFPTLTSLVSTSLDAVIAVHSYKAVEISSTTLISATDPIVTAVALPGGRVVTASRKPTLRVWDPSRRVEITSAQLNVPFVRCTDKMNHDDGEDADDDAVTVAHVARNADGILVALSDQTLLTVAAKPNAPLRLLQRVICGNLEEIYDVRFLLVDGMEGCRTKIPPVVVASNSPVVWVMQPPQSVTDVEWTSKAALHAHTGNILAVDMVKGNRVTYVASASRDRTARVWCRYRAGSCNVGDISGGWACVAVAEGHADAVSAIALPPRVIAGKFFIVTAAADRTLKLWNMEAVRKAVEKREQEFEHEGHNALEDNDCSIVDVTGAEDGVTSLSAKWTVLAHEKDVNAVAVSPDGSMIASGSQDRSLKLWTVEQGKLHMTCKGHRRGIWSVAFSSVDRVVASGSGDATIRIWNVQDGSCLRTLQGHMSGVLRVLFISRGTQIASCGSDGLVKVWTTRSGECDTTVDAHEDRVWGIDVVNDGDLAVSGGADGRIVLWHDCSAELEHARAKRKEDEVMMAQAVDSAARACKWSMAAIGALELGMSQKLKSIVSQIVTTTDMPEVEMVSMVKGVFEGTGGLGVDNAKRLTNNDEREEDVMNKKRWERIGKLFLVCRDWNASGGAKSAAIAGYLLQGLLSVWNVDELCDKLKLDKRGLVEALDAHCGRHLERMNQLTTKVAMLEHTLNNMH